MDAEAEVRIRGSSKGNLRVSDGAVFQRLAAGVMSYRLRLRMLSGDRCRGVPRQTTIRNQ